MASKSQRAYSRNFYRRGRTLTYTDRLSQDGIELTQEHLTQTVEEMS
jgi:hypothetical protein